MGEDSYFSRNYDPKGIHDLCKDVMPKLHPSDQAALRGDLNLYSVLCDIYEERRAEKNDSSEENLRTILLMQSQIEGIISSSLRTKEKAARLFNQASMSLPK